MNEPETAFHHELHQLIQDLAAEETRRRCDEEGATLEVAFDAVHAEVASAVGIGLAAFEGLYEVGAFYEYEEA